MTKVMCFGTFDILHPGHLSYFRQARKYGDELIVVIARDKNVRKKRLIFNEKERRQIVHGLKIVDRTVLGNIKDSFKIIEQIKPGIICLGYDHQIKEKTLRKELKKRNLSPQIERAKAYHPEKFKSSKIKEIICGAV